MLSSDVEVIEVLGILRNLNGPNKNVT